MKLQEVWPSWACGWHPGEERSSSGWAQWMANPRLGYMNRMCLWGVEPGAAEVNLGQVILMSHLSSTIAALTSTISASYDNYHLIFLLSHPENRYDLCSQMQIWSSEMHWHNRINDEFSSLKLETFIISQHRWAGALAQGLSKGYSQEVNLDWSHLKAQLRGILLPLSFRWPRQESAIGHGPEASLFSDVWATP